MLFIISICGVLQISCVNDSEDDLTEISEDPQQGIVTYNANVQPIMTNSCTACHGAVPTNGAPFSLVTYEQVSARAEGVFNAMSRNSGSSGAMPPSGKLPLATINIIDQWIIDGLKE